MLNKSYNKFVALACLVLPIMLIFLSLFVGRYDLKIIDILSILIEREKWISDPERAIEYSLVFDIRLPRALLAFVVGGALSICGGALQGMFRNPLVDSGMLGVSAGAGFGAPAIRCPKTRKAARTAGCSTGFQERGYC